MNRKAIVLESIRIILAVAAGTIIGQIVLDTVLS